MKLKILCLVVLCFAITGSSEARKKNRKRNKADLVLIEAYTQRTLPGVRRAIPPPAMTHFIAVWVGVSYPDAFLWRADTGLLTCSVTKAHKIANKTRYTPPGIEYYTEKVDPKDIRKGDTLDIVPLQITSAVPGHLHMDAGARNTLYYKILIPTITGDEWFSFHIDSIGRKRDIAMP